MIMMIMIMIYPFRAHHQEGDDHDDDDDDEDRSRTTPHCIKIKPNYCPPGPQSPTRKTPLQDHCNPVKTLIRTNTCSMVGNCPGGELSG